MDHSETLKLAGDAFQQTASSLTANQLARQSNCEEWTVRDLVNHVINGCIIATELVGGASAETAGSLRSQPVTGDVLEALRSAVAAQYRALSAPQVAGLTVTHPITTMTGAQLIQTRTVEFVVHQWDIRASLGLPANTDDRVAAAAWAAMEPLAGLTADLGVFGTGTTRDLAETASPLDRLIHVTGRST